uniref:Rab3 GTPase-activating protein catalytic subunit n=1 Tax=Leersia perrieri TaxID=77586 RepID=A0A0D9VSY4_9ORYZ
MPPSDRWLAKISRHVESGEPEIEGHRFSYIPRVRDRWRIGETATLAAQRRRLRLQLERFDDFTIASSWERFISEIEAICRQWLADGPKILMDFFNWIIAPLSASGVVLDDPESTKLLSSVAVALSNCGGNWPAFVPVHDPSRKAYIGIQNLGTVFTRRFEADRIGSQVLSSTDFPARVKVNFSMKLTYRTPEYDYDNEETLVSEANETIAESEVANHPKKQWDDDCSWAEWYSAEDPVKGFELTTIWGERMFEETLEMAEVENASSFDADSWLLYPIVSPYMVNDSIGKFVGFASQLQLLTADTSGQENSKSTVTVPPPSVVDRVMKDLFSDEVGSSNYVEAENKYGRAMKGAPSDSLFAQFCLHALWFGNCNIRAIAVLWIDFVREIRWCWEESEHLPRMKITSSIDLSTCLIHQKLHMLAICIDRKKSLSREKGTDRAHEDGISSNSVGKSGQLERDVLSSDMSAFKAANPDAVFEDFIRWHSPGDWVLHYLETVRPQQLLEQMVCTAFKSSADILNRATYGDFKLMKSKMDQLYATLASTLKSLQGESDISDLSGDLKRLCQVFEHIEKLLILAASVHRKLLDAPCLAQAIFADYFNYYLPKMGTSLESVCYEKEFTAKEKVGMHERDVVSNLFPPPTANQSWRKVLSMGNLLNGHEPIQREIVFSVIERISNGHYSSPTPLSTDEQIETHRMYISGTSNDLWVALSVTSWD